MRKFIALFFATVALIGSLPPVRAITIDTVPVGDAGNASDPATGMGSVAYDYRMGTTEVTLGQYTSFLNAVAVSDVESLWDSNMAISRTGSFGGYSYSVIGSPNKPATYVELPSALRFVNWLENGQPVGAEGPGTTDMGTYDLSDPLHISAVRSADATWVLPNENEWYKAAYHQPTAKGGDSDGYWAYPTGTNTPPTSAPPGSTPNTGNFYDPVTGLAVTGSTTFDPAQDYTTDVGSYTQSGSYYGTFDQGGNVSEWIEHTMYYGTTLRGGYWATIADAFKSTGPQANIDQGFNAGFRVAMVPEPSTLALAALGLTALAAFGWWRQSFNFTSCGSER